MRQTSSTQASEAMRVSARSIGKQGQAVPALYGGTTRDYAMMETAFHAVPYTAGFKSYGKAKLVGKMHSTIQLSAPLQLINLAGSD